MFSLSLLPTAHPCPFQRTRVRPSTPCYRSFSLAMSRSPGFGSTAPYSFALFRLGFPPAPGLLSLNLAPYRNSQAHSTKGTPSPSLKDQALTACKSMVSGSLSLPSRGAFHHFPHGTRSLSVAVSYLALEGGPPRFRQGSSCPAVLRYALGVIGISHTGLSPSPAGLPSTVPLSLDSHVARPTTPASP